MTAPGKAPAAPVVETGCGPVRGFDDGMVRVWKGIRYGAPPVGGLRWRAPQPPEPWREIADANAFGPACPQPRTPMPLGPGARTSEDCLFLNVWAPSTATDSGVPVLVWVHGGGFIIGSGSQPLFDAHTLVADAATDNAGIIVVTLNYRVGALGFLNLGGFDAGGRRFDSNPGIRDVLHALQWVHDNIAAFGGDPRRVTLAGESAGALIAATLLTSSAAAGLFHRTIVQSGPVTSVYHPDRAHRAAELFLNRLGRSAAQAASAPLADVLDAGMKVFADVPTATPGVTAFAPVVDGELVGGNPARMARAGRTLPVPLLIGTNRDETTMFRFMNLPVWPIKAKTREMMRAELVAGQPDIEVPSEHALQHAYAHVRPWLRGLRIAGDISFRMPALWLADGHCAVAPVYLYRFDRATVPLRLLALDATHGSELPYLFANPMIGPHDLGVRLAGPTEATLSRRLRSRWVNFVHGRAPDGLPGDPAWRPYHAGERATLVIDRRDALVLDLDRKVREAWGEEVISFR